MLCLVELSDVRMAILTSAHLVVTNALARSYFMRCCFVLSAILGRSICIKSIGAVLMCSENCLQAVTYVMLSSDGLFGFGIRLVLNQAVAHALGSCGMCLLGCWVCLIKLRQVNVLLSCCLLC